MKVISQCYNVSSTDGRNNSSVTAEDAKKGEAPENSMVCPRCGGNLILRTARKGENAGNQFYGCSNFPKCRYVENL